VVLARQAPQREVCRARRGVVDAAECVLQVRQGGVRPQRAERGARELLDAGLAAPQPRGDTLDELGTDLTVALCLGATGCATGKQAVGIRKVDDLVGKVERAHLECELVQERVHAALDALAVVVGPVPAEDPAVAFQQLVVAIDAADEQAERLSATIPPMETASASVFARWETDLETFASPQMRQRSQARLDATRGLYAEVPRTVEPVASAAQVFNTGLRDLSIFLGHDLNAASVSEVEAEILALRRQVVTLDQRVDDCLTAARNYLRSAAPVGQIEVQGSRVPK
jgi:hypothetical protein